jgi:hypothetical protein
MTPGSQQSLPISRNGRSVREVCMDAARQAGSLVGSRFLTEKEVSFKGRADIVTDVDLASEKLDPASSPAHVFRLRRHERTEAQFEYFL